MADGYSPFLVPAYEVISRFLKRQVTILAFGAEQTGKTAYMRALHHLSETEYVFGSPTTLGLVPAEINIPLDMARRDSIVRIIYNDIGGHKTLNRMRLQAFRQIEPLGILFFLDHRAPETKDRDNRQVDDGSIDFLRLRRHRKAFQELTEILSENEKLRKKCHAIVFIVNKSDLWVKEGGNHVNVFSDYFQEDIQKLMNASDILSVSEFVPCSVFDNNGIKTSINRLVDLSGWEIPMPILKNLKFRFKGK